MKKLVLFVVVALILAVFAIAQTPPVRNVSGKKHPNLNAAQRLTAQAFKRITDAQVANEWDMDGHAAKAKDLLDQANSELKKAAMAANKGKK